MSYITSTMGLMELAKNADTGGYENGPRNRSVYVDKLKDTIHPDGKHLCMMRFLHNDVEWRTQWMVRLKDGEGEEMGAGIWGTQMWLDVDFDMFKTWTTEIDDDSTDHERIQK